MTPIGKQTSPKLSAEEKESRAYWRAENKRQREYDKLNRFNLRRELNILKFMLQTDVKDHHHGRAHSTVARIKDALERVKTSGKYSQYDPYIWNRQGEGKNYMPVCQFHCIFSHKDFDSIYDVPLDGTYHFQIYDSGERGLGSFNRITAIKVEEPVYVPFVNPGALIPITSN
jgi:hypothetical protein